MLFEDRLAELTPEQRELFERFLHQEQLTAAVAKDYRPPRTSTERALVAIWSELLGVDVGIDDNYFELGGDSITIIRMVSRARSDGIAIKTEWVFSHPTIASLAAVCRLDQPAPSSPASSSATDDLARLRQADPEFERDLRRVGVVAREAYPLMPTQQGILFHTLDQPFDGCYAVQWRFRLQGRLDTARFQRAWATMIERHDVLRTVFRWTGLEEPLQVVLDRADAGVIEETRPSGDWPAIAADVLEEERRTVLDPQRAPLMRIRFVRLAPDEWLCVWTHHHLILDGWSQQILLEEFFLAYRGLPLPPVTPGLFRDHVSRVRARDEMSDASFWQRQMAGYQPPERPLTNERGNGHQVLRRTVAGARRTREQLQRQAVTMSVLYQSAWALALAQVSEQADLVFGVVCSGRSSATPGIDRAVGLFINTLPFRVMVDPSLLLSAFLARVRGAQMELVQYEDCGLLSIQKWIGWDRRAPLVSSLYVYERFPLQLDALERSESLAIRDIDTTTLEHYPLVFIVQDDDDVTTLTLKHRGASPETIVRLERAFDVVASLADRLGDRPGLTIGELMEGRGR